MDRVSLHTRPTRVRWRRQSGLSKHPLLVEARACLLATPRRPSPILESQEPRLVLSSGSWFKMTSRFRPHRLSPRPDSIYSTEVVLLRRQRRYPGLAGLPTMSFAKPSQLGVSRTASAILLQRDPKLPLPRHLGVWPAVLALSDVGHCDRPSRGALGGVANTEPLYASSGGATERNLEVALRVRRSNRTLFPTFRTWRNAFSVNLAASPRCARQP
jgi:hypothetical protein